MKLYLAGPLFTPGERDHIDGIFSELVRTDPGRYRGIIGLATDWRIWRSRDAGAADNGINFFVGGAIEAYGKIVWSIEEVETALSEFP